MAHSAESAVAAPAILKEVKPALAAGHPGEGGTAPRNPEGAGPPRSRPLAPPGVPALQPYRARRTREDPARLGPLAAAAGQ